MIVLLPLSRYKVTFRTAVGVPHSRLEHLMVRALGQGIETLDDLEATFVIHRRLIIQSLVGLIQEGYVALGPEGRFLLTEDGEAVASGVQLERVRETPVRSTSVVMERLLGLVAPAREVRFVGRRELDELMRPRRLEPHRHDRRLDPAQVRHLIPRGPDEWVRSIEDVRLLSRDASWLPVRVDPQGQRIIGVPDRWSRLLAATLLQDSPSDSPPSEEDNRWFDRRHDATGSIGTSDVRLTGTAYDRVFAEDLIDSGRVEATLAHALEEATDMIAIAAPAISVAAVRGIEAAITGALRRGTDVHLLAGGADPATWEELKGLRYRLRDERLEVAASPQIGHLSGVILRRSGRWEALVGSVAWLAQDYSGQALALRAPIAVASFAEAIAGAWRGAPGQSLSSVPDRWTTVAARLEAGTVQVHVEDAEPLSLSDDARGELTRLRVVLGGEAEKLLAVAEEASGPRSRSDGEHCVLGWSAGVGAGAIAVELVGPGVELVSSCGAEPANGSR